MSEVPCYEFTDRAGLDQALAERVASALRSAIAKRGEANLVVSGGSTPVGVFRTLSDVALDWSAVRITLADERWVAVDHGDSNERLVREHLLRNSAAGASFTSLFTGHKTAEEGEEEVARRLSAFPLFDVVMLGMGEDGHTASLFPESEALVRGQDLSSNRSCLAVQPSHAPHQRMSLTLRRLLQARLVILHITGQGKRDVFERAQESKDPLRWPIAAVLGSTEPTVNVYWAP